MIRNNLLSNIYYIHKSIKYLTSQDLLAKGIDVIYFEYRIHICGLQNGIWEKLLKDILDKYERVIYLPSNNSYVNEIVLKGEGKQVTPILKWMDWTRINDYT